MRVFQSVRVALAIGLTVALVTSAAGQETRPNEPITVFVARKIVTMDPGLPEATAVAVRGGRILSVGSRDDLKPWLDSAPYKVDNTFADKVLMPGFIEAHGHPLLGGVLLTRPLLTHYPSPNPYGPPFPGLKTRADALAKLKEYEQAMSDPDETLVAWGFDIVVFGGHLTKDELDKVSTTRPIIVWDASEHFAYVNGVVLRQRGYTADLAKKVNGVQLGADGQLNGQFLGTTAASFVLADFMKSQMQPAAAVKALDFLVDLSAQGGITTQSELALGILSPDAEAALYEQYFGNPGTPMRLVAVSDITGVTRAKKDKAIDYVRQLQDRSSDRVIFRGVKSFCDDSFLGLAMVIENPGYIDGHSGIFIKDAEALIPQLLPFWKAGFQIHVHTNGNAGQDNVLAALAELQRQVPRFDHRFTFEHYGISTLSHAKRLKALGALASVNPYYVYFRGELNEAYLGTDRAHLASRFHTLLDAGVPTTMHSDTPIGPPKPLEWVWIAVNRFGQSGEVLGPAERITVPEALRMITIGAAYVLGVDDRLGSIEAGKLADFTVLDQDPYAVAPEKLRDVKVWGTVVGGRLFPRRESPRR